MGGDSQTAVVGQLLTDTLVVQLTNINNDPVAGVDVQFTILAGGTGGSLNPATARSNADGLAKSVWTLAHIAGEQKVRAQVSGTPLTSGLYKDFVATALPDVPDTVFAVAGDSQSSIVSQALADSLSVLVTDQFGNPITGESVNWAVPANQGTVSSPLLVTGPDGRTSVQRVLGPTAGTQTATASVTGLKGSPVTFTSTAVPSGAAKLVKLFGDSPVQVAPAGSRLTDSMVVQTQDALGNGVPGRSVVWTVTAGGGSVSAASSVTDAQGKAFVFLTLGTTAGTNTIQATSPGLSPVNFTATGISAQASKLVGNSVLTQNGTAGLAVGAPPSVKVTDINNNPVQGVTVTFTVTAGGGTVSDGTASTATATVASGANGVATLASWTLGAVAGANTVTASANGPGAVPLTGSPITFSATGAVGAAALLAVTTQPSPTTASGAALATQPIVQVQDAFHNNVAQAGVNVTAAVSVGGTLTGTATVATNASGQATFSGLVISGLAGSYTLTFTSTSPVLTPVTSSPIVVGVGVPTKLALTTQPSATAQNGVILPQQPVVQVQDNGGNNVGQAGVSVLVAVSTGGTLSGVTTVVTGATGAATFTGLAIAAPIGSYTLTFTSTNPVLTPVTSNSISLGAGLVTKLAITTPPSTSAQSGVAIPTQPVVQLQDAGGNNVSTANVSVTATVSTGGTLTGTAAVLTNANGQAVFSGLTISGLIGSYTLTFTSGTLTPAVSGAISLSAGPATQLFLSTQPSAGAQSGIAFAQQPVVQLRDNGNNNVSSGGISVAVAVSAGGTLGGTTPVLTNSSGQAVFSGLSISGASGSYTLSFTSGTLTPATSSPIILGAGAPNKLSIITQPSATAANGTPFAAQPVIQLLDAANNPVALAGTSVTAAIASGTGATLTTTLTVSTNASGQAVFSGLTLTGTVGTFTLSFTASGLPNPSITSGNIVLSAGAANKLSITRQPSTTASSGVAFSTQPIIQLLDISNNVVTTSGVVVTAAIQTGSGATLGGGLTATTNSSGAATFANLMLTGTAGNFTLNFTSGSLTAITSTNIALGAGLATKLSITTQPSSNATNATAFPQQPAIQLLDASNNPVPQSGVVISAAVVGSGAALGGGLTASTNSSGLATFSNLMLTGTVGSYSLNFTSGTLTPIGSGSIALGAGAVSQITITTQPPATATSGAPLSTQPVVQLRDVSSNPVNQSGVAITAQIASGSGSLSNAIAVTNSAGTATFSGLAITGSAGPYTLNFTNGSFTSPSSSTITLSAGTATQLVVTQQPSTSAASGAVFAQQPIVQLRDAGNNNVPQANVSVTATVSAGGSLVGNFTVLTNGSGQAVYSGLGINGLVGSYTLTFTAGVLQTTSNAISITVGAAAIVNINTQPSATVQSGVTFPTVPVVTVTDGGGNPINAQSVSISVASGSALTFTNGTATTNASGVATFTGLVATGATGARTLRFTAGAASVVSNPVTVNAGTPATVTINTQPSANVQSGVTFPTVPVVTVTDGGGNPVPSQSVTLSVATGSALTFTNGTATTNGSGVATFTGLAVTGTTGARTLLFTAGGATATSSTVTVGAGAAATVTINTQPSSPVQSGVTFPTVPVVTVTDGGGNPVASQSVTLSVATGSALTFTNGTATTNGSGVATFTGLAVTGTVGVRTLRFTAGSATATSGNVTVNAGNPATVTINTQPPSSVQNGATFGTVPVVTVTDGAGNPVQSQSVSVSVASGGALSFTNGTATTNSSGQATFTGLVATGLVGSRTLRFTAGSAQSTPSNSVNVTPGQASASQTTASVPSTGAVGSPTIINVQAKDASGNLLITGGNTVAVTIQAGSANPGTLSVTDNTDGTYTATYDPAASGTDTIAITLDGNPIAGSPFTSTIP
jgi:hypothetical protein